MTDLDTSTDSSRSLSQIQQWITTCEEKHHRCGRRRKEPDSVPTHLLDITEINLAPKDSARIRVVLTAKQGIREPYVTLSHRWADSAEFIQLTKSNMESLTTIGFEWCDPLLPKTFKDAILLARRMDISYMWIDSLCIIQERKPHQNNPEDNTPETETQKESKLMHRYYRNSFCNISTADSGSGQEGLFRQRDPASSEGSIRSSIIPPTVVAGASNLIFGGSTWRVVPDSLWDTQLLGNVLYTRAWVFQGQYCLSFPHSSSCTHHDLGNLHVNRTNAVTSHTPLLEEPSLLGVLYNICLRRHTRWTSSLVKHHSYQRQTLAVSTASRIFPAPTTAGRGG